MGEGNRQESETEKGRQAQGGRGGQKAGPGRSRGQNNFLSRRTLGGGKVGKRKVEGARDGLDRRHEASESGHGRGAKAAASQD